MHSLESFKNLYYNHHEMVVRTAFFILNDFDHSEDLAQDVFTNVWEKYESLGDIENFQAYLRTTTKNLALNKLKQIKSKVKREQDYVDFFLKNDDELALEDINYFLKVLKEMLTNLPPKCRLIFSMSRFEELSNDQIAQQLGISKRTVETQISNALKYLRKEFKDRDEEFLSIFIPFLLALEINL